MVKEISFEEQVMCNVATIEATNDKVIGKDYRGMVIYREDPFEDLEEWMEYSENGTLIHYKNSNGDERFASEQKYPTKKEVIDYIKEKNLKSNCKDWAEFSLTPHSEYDIRMRALASKAIFDDNAFICYAYISYSQNMSEDFIEELMFISSKLFDFDYYNKQSIDAVVRIIDAECQYDEIRNILESSDIDSKLKTTLDALFYDIRAKANNVAIQSINRLPVFSPFVQEALKCKTLDDELKFYHKVIENKRNYNKADVNIVLRRLKQYEDHKDDKDFKFNKPLFRAIFTNKHITPEIINECVDRKSIKDCIALGMFDEFIENYVTKKIKSNYFFVNDRLNWKDIKDNKNLSLSPEFIKRHTKLFKLGEYNSDSRK